MFVRQATQKRLASATKLPTTFSCVRCVNRQMTNVYTDLMFSMFEVHYTFTTKYTCSKFTFIIIIITLNVLLHVSVLLGHHRIDNSYKI